MKIADGGGSGIPQSASSTRISSGPNTVSRSDPHGRGGSLDIAADYKRLRAAGSLIYNVPVFGWRSVCGLFFLSGISGLIYQVLWLRRLSVIVGVTLIIDKTDQAPR